MKTSFRTITLTVLLGAALAAGSTQVLAQSTNKASTSTTKKSTTEKKDTSTKDSTTKKTAGHPFHGKLASVDKVNKTITLGKSTYQITSESKIKKGDKPAMLEDGVVGEEVSGYAKPAEDGKMVATTVTFGSKASTTSTTSTTTDKKKSKETTPKDTPTPTTK